LGLHSVQLRQGLGKPGVGDGLHWDGDNRFFSRTSLSIRSGVYDGSTRLLESVFGLCRLDLICCDSAGVSIARLPSALPEIGATAPLKR